MKFTLPALGTLFSRKAIIPRRSQKSFHSRLLATERLEKRAMLAADALSAWQNAALPSDVNADGYVTPIDALRIINELNTSGPRDLSSSPPAISRASFMSAGEAPASYLDVNGDGKLTASDALVVINSLSEAQDDQVRVRVQVTDLDGNPIDVIAPGQEFQIRGFVKDIRQPETDPQRGVFSVYVDVNYDPTLMEVDLDGRTIEYGEEYEVGHRSNAQITATAGLLDDIGALATGLNPTGPEEFLVFVVPMTATGRGVTTLTLDTEDGELLEVGVFGSNQEVPADEIQFVGDLANIGFPPAATDDTAEIFEDSGVATIDVLANDTVNPQGLAPLQVVAVTPAANGTVVVPIGGGNVEYTPFANFSGEDTFTYTVEDVDGNQATATVTVTVTGLNDPPTPAADTFTVDADSTDNILLVLANDTDIDGDELHVSALNQPDNGGSVSLAPGGTHIIYTPAPGFVGTETFGYLASDGILPVLAQVTVTVNDDNPIAAPDAITDVAEDSTGIVLNVLENDALAPGVVGELLIVGVGETSHGGTVAIGDDDKTLVYTPAPNFAGTESFTYRIVDGQGGEATGIVSVSVTNSADPPTATDDAVTVVEDTTDNTLDVLANDTDPDVGDTLTITAVGVGSAGGTIEIAPDGVSLIYTPLPNFFDTETFTYTVTDVDGQTDTATVEVTVTDVTEQPTAGDDEFTFAEDSTGNMLDVFANDSDPDAGDTLMIVGVTDGSLGGMIEMAGDGMSLIYTPAADAFGVETFMYEISDGRGGMDTATVTIHITAVNDPPTAVDDSPEILEGSTDNVLDVLANDSDAPDEGETITITAVGMPSAGGTVTIGDGGLNLIYTPDAEFRGNETFTYTIDDGTGMTATATVTVQVNPLNAPPVAIDDAISINEDQLNVTIEVLDNDTDPEGDTLMLSGVSDPAHGMVTLSGDGLSLVYTPLSNFHGVDTFTYMIDDGNGGTDTATVTITVASVNDLPPIASDNPTVAEDSGATTLDLLANDLLLPNPDGQETLTIVAVGGATNGGTIAIAPDGLSVTYTPAANFVGAETFSYTIRDDGGAESTTTVEVTVTPVNDSPTPADDTFDVTRDTSSNVLNVLANDTDPDAGDTLTLTITVVGATDHGGTVTIAADNRSLRYTPAAGFVGTETFEYTVSDDNGGTDTATVTVTVRDFQTGSLSGFVYVDANGNGVKDGAEQALRNVTIRLWGTDVLGQSVNITTTTDATGAYRFNGLRQGSYVIEQTQPSAFTDGAESIGSQGGMAGNTAGHDQFFIALAAGQNGVNNNFGERGLRPEFIGRANFFLP